METSGARAYDHSPRTPVLLLDDDPALLRIMQEVLGSAGYDCIACNHPDDALEVLAGERDVRVIVSDICMPDIDGLMFLDRVNLLRAERMPRVLLLTAHPTLDRAIAALRLGATDFLVKPVSPKDLLSAVDRACGRAAQSEAAAGQSSWTPESLAKQAEMLAMRLRAMTAAAPPTIERELPSAPVPALPAKDVSTDEAQRQLRTAQLLDSMEQLRRLRRRNRAGLEDMDDIAWELLMEVLRSAREGRQISVSGLTISVEGVSPTTALRRINELVTRGHLLRTPDPADARRDFVALNAKTREALEDYLARAAEYLA